MNRLSHVLAAGLAAAGLAFGGATVAEAQKAGKGGGTCVNKAGQGTGSTEANAKFQAWEAVLQATDWGSWATFMAGGQKIGTAPGYAVSKVGTKCWKGGLGAECKMQATLCK